MTVYTADVLIIGAGLSGLAAAQQLSQHGLQVMLADKGRSVGGRLATRRMGGGLADHGAQFFTVRSTAFQDAVQRWTADNIVYVWAHGFSDGTRQVNDVDGHPRYAARNGMNAIAKYLAQSLPANASIHTDVKIMSCRPAAAGWEAVDDKGHHYYAKALLMTPPVPQALELLGEAGAKLHSSEREALEHIRYVPCVAGLFKVEGDVDLPDPGALQRPEADISWIADNQRKGISPAARIITVHSGIRISQQLWERPENEALDLLRNELERRLVQGAVIREAEVKRWRYSQPVSLHPDRYLMADGLSGLCFAGDAFGEARVEGAFLSGLAAGTALAAALG